MGLVPANRSWSQAGAAQRYSSARPDGSAAAAGADGERPRGSRPGSGLLRAAALVAVVAGLAGCQNIAMESGSPAQLRVIDASPDAPAVDAYKNNEALAYNLGFGTVTSYVPVAPGSTTLAADKAGTRQALVAGAASLTPGRQYTTIVGNIDAAMRQTVLLDQSQPAPAGEIAVRLVDQATRAGAVNVYLVPKGGKLATASPIATRLRFGGNSGYRDLPAGVYELAVVPAGTVPVASTVTLLSGDQIDYASGSARTIVLIDTPASPMIPAASRAAFRGVRAIVAQDYHPTGE